MALANGFKEKVCVLAKTADQLNDDDIPEKVVFLKRKLL